MKPLKWLFIGCFFESEAKAEKEYLRATLERTIKGRAAQYFDENKKEWISYELHHVIPQGQAISAGQQGEAVTLTCVRVHTPFNLREMTCEQHAAVDTFRHAGPTTSATI
eukprot:g13641.t1